MLLLFLFIENKANKHFHTILSNSKTNTHLYTRAHYYKENYGLEHTLLHDDVNNTLKLFSKESLKCGGGVSNANAKDIEMIE